MLCNTLGPYVHVALCKTTRDQLLTCWEGGIYEKKGMMSMTKKYVNPPSTKRLWTCAEVFMHVFDCAKLSVWKLELPKNGHSQLSWWISFTCLLLLFLKGSEPPLVIIVCLAVCENILCFAILMAVGWLGIPCSTLSMKQWWKCWDYKSSSEK
jgi:hypothetical protein